MNIRKKLGIGPGSVLEWEEDGDTVKVRRVGTFSSADIHKAAFGSQTPRKRSVEEMKEGIGTYVRNRYARG